MAERTREHNERIEALMAHSLVQCPRCGAQAKARDVEEGRRPTFRGGLRVVPLRRVVCTACGYAHPPVGHSSAQDQPSDTLSARVTAPASYQYLALWLQTPCLGHVLWAYNREHLDFIERQVRKAGKTSGDTPGQRSDMRLSDWMADPLNGHEVQRAIARLRSLLDN